MYARKILVFLLPDAWADPDTKILPRLHNIYLQAYMGRAFATKGPSTVGLFPLTKTNNKQTCVFFNLATAERPQHCLFVCLLFVLVRGDSPTVDGPFVVNAWPI